MKSLCIIKSNLYLCNNGGILSEFDTYALMTKWVLQIVQIEYEYNIWGLQNVNSALCTLHSALILNLNYKSKPNFSNACNKDDLQ